MAALLKGGIATKKIFDGRFGEPGELSSWQSIKSTVLMPLPVRLNGRDWSLIPRAMLSALSSTLTKSCCA